MCRPPRRLRRPARRPPPARRGRPAARQRSILAWRSKASHTVKISGSSKASASRSAPDKAVGPRRLGRDRQQPGAILDQPRDRLMRAIPLQHREFGMVQRRALAVAEHMSEGENPLLARRQQLFAGEFRRGMQIKPAFVASRADQLHAERRNMRFIAARDLQRGRLHLDKSLMGEKLPNCRPEQGADLEKGLAVGVNILVPTRAKRASLLGHPRFFGGEDLRRGAKCGFNPHMNFDPFIDRTGRRRQS